MLEIILPIMGFFEDLHEPTCCFRRFWSAQEMKYLSNLTKQTVIMHSQLFLLADQIQKWSTNKRMHCSVTQSPSYVSKTMTNLKLSHQNSDILLVFALDEMLWQGIEFIFRIVILFWMWIRLY